MVRHRVDFLYVSFCLSCKTLLTEPSTMAPESTATSRSISEHLHDARHEVVDGMKMANHVHNSSVPVGMLPRYIDTHRHTLMSHTGCKYCFLAKTFPHPIKSRVPICFVRPHTLK